MDTPLPGGPSATIRQAGPGAPVGRVAAGAPSLSIVICTYQRPVLLEACLSSCLRQTVPAGCSYEIIVVDNDALGSAWPVVDGLTAGSVGLRYVVEAEANIALARNRGVEESRGAVIAFIDDDFVVPETWLGHVLAALHDADVVLGDVRPVFEASGAAADLDPGVIQAFTRQAPETAGRVPIRGDGYVPGARSGNAVLRRRCFAGSPPWFDPAFGRSGGEDSDFFMRLGRRRPRIVRSAAGYVLDFVPKERQTTAYVLARARREGRNYARLVLKNSACPPLSAVNLVGRGVLQAVAGWLRLAGCRRMTPEQRLATGIRLNLALGKAMLAGAARDVPYR